MAKPSTLLTNLTRQGTLGSMRRIAIVVFLLVSFLRADALELRILSSGTPSLTNATVAWTTGSRTNTVAANAQGIVTIPPPEYASTPLHVTATKPGRVPMTMRWPAGKVPARFEIRLPEAQRVTGRVADESGTGIPNAKITLIVPQRLAGPFVAPENLSVVSDTNGVWTSDSVPTGAAYVQIEVAHPDFESAQTSPPTESLDQPVEFRLSPVVTVSGRVIDHAGRPVEAAQVVLGNERGIQPGSSTSETTTDARGNFEFRRERLQKRMLGLYASNSAPVLHPIDLKRNLPPVEVQLTRGAPLTVRVVDPRGNPLPGVSVNVDEWPSSLRVRTTRSGTEPRWMYPGWEWQTDSEGRFIWSNAPPEATSFTFRKGGYMTKSRHNLEPQADEQVVALGETFHVTGKVTDARTDKTLPEFTVNARFALVSSFAAKSMTNYGPWSEYSRKTFRNGEFSWSFEYPLLSGSAQMHDWQFRAEAEGYEPAESRVLRDAERGAQLEFSLAPRALPEILVADPSPTNRVAAGIVVVPNRVRYGNNFEVFIRVRVADGFYIYALDDSGTRNEPTSLAGPTSPFFKATGPWRSPGPKPREDGSRTFTGDVLFQRSFILVDQGVGPGFEKLSVPLRFQVCNESLCWPPQTIHLETTVEKLPSQ